MLKRRRFTIICVFWRVYVCVRAPICAPMERNFVFFFIHFISVWILRNARSNAICKSLNMFTVQWVCSSGICSFNGIENCGPTAKEMHNKLCVSVGRSAGCFNSLFKILKNSSNPERLCNKNALDASIAYVVFCCFFRFFLFLALAPARAIKSKLLLNGE